jgi:glycosyltransferase involved in cell wall biosynthesis
MQDTTGLLTFGGKGKVLILLDYYVPGFKSGGPLRTIASLVDWIGDRLDFWIVTRDRDATDSASYPHIQINTWIQVGKAKVYYASPGSLSLVNLYRLVNYVCPEVIYLNSFFSALTIKFLSLRRFRFLSKIPVILAPRGEFSIGALQLKTAKKQLYIALALKAGLYNDLIWHASSIREEQDIRQVIGNHCRVDIAPNIPSPSISRENRLHQKPPKRTGQACFVFLSRISPKKNLLQALCLLREMPGEIAFDIYGPIRDEVYWQHCKDLIESMPSNIQVNYRGPVPHVDVFEKLSQSHFFLLPTLGENFGHVILEAMSAGCPVLISDQTPWVNLSADCAGWDLPLEQPDLWRLTLKKCIDMDNTVYSHWSQSAHQFVQEWLMSSDLEGKNLALFIHALGH